MEFTQSCPTLCDPMDYTVHGTLQARILEWVAFPFSRVQGHQTSIKLSRCKGTEIIQSLFSYHCGIILEINIKRYLKITHIFSSTMWHLPIEFFDVATENLNKVRRLKKTEGDCSEERSLVRN